MPTTSTDLVIGGMTCASCATRIEKKLNKLDGVTATVNCATEAARVSFPETLTVAVLIIACPCAMGLATRPRSWSAPAAPRASTTLLTGTPKIGGTSRQIAPLSTPDP